MLGLSSSNSQSVLLHILYEECMISLKGTENLHPACLSQMYGKQMHILIQLNELTIT